MRTARTDRLRIAQVAPAAAPVTPRSTSSIEHLVWLLTEELVRRGHEVTLFATGNSETSAELHACYLRGYEEDEDLWNWQFHETMHMAAAFERASEFDLVHSHAYHYALPFIRLTDRPVVHTYHVLPDPDIVRAYARCPEVHVVALSHYQRRLYKSIADVPVIHHGIDTNAFSYSPEPGEYLLFLGRLIPDKGVVEAIEIARQAGMPLVLAGPIECQDFFRRQLAPQIDGRDIRYAGPVGTTERNAFLAGAAALIYPIVEPEPFGLVLIEAMACGTPVIARGLGAVPELVDEGVTGYAPRYREPLAGRVRDALILDRAVIRHTAVARFDYRRMADQYEAMYRRLVGEPRTGGIV
jgi:glycosyltransferase involved in cell wall biosynthesis